eukprot:s193_g22.t1
MKPVSEVHVAISESDAKLLPSCSRALSAPLPTGPDYPTYRPSWPQSCSDPNSCRAVVALIPQDASERVRQTSVMLDSLRLKSLTTKKTANKE